MPFTTTTKKLALAINAGLLALTAGSAFAAGQIEEVTVTAEKREASLQTTPIAISAFSSESLEKLGIGNFQGVAQNSPAITFTPYPSSSMLILYMRGQGVSDPAQITTDSSIGIYSDGFFIARPQAAVFDLADLERVEVLRGPQGTLYGRNTTGGAVNLISKKPTGEFGFKQDFSFGTRDYFRSQTSIDLPKWNDISTKLTILKSDKDGFVKNPGSSNDFGESHQLGGRFALHWDISANVTADYFMEKGKGDTTPSYYQNKDSQDHLDHPADRAYRAVDLPMSHGDFEGHGLTLAWDVNESLTVKSLTGYRKLNTDEFQDYAESFFFGTASHDLVNEHQFSQEFQFIGDAFNKRIKYITGLYYFKEGASHFENYKIDGFFADPLDPLNPLAFRPGHVNKDRYATNDAKSQAAYAQVTWTPPILDDKLEVTVGARYTKDDRSATRSLTNTGSGPYFDYLETIFPFPFPGPNHVTAFESGAKNSQSFKRFNPMFTVNYAVNEDVSVYGKIATGYKAGGFSESSPPGSFTQGFSPEKVTTYELGTKSYWWDRRVRANIALFQSKFDDMQLFFTVDPADSSVIQAYNAGKATVNGAELDLLVMPIDDLSLSLEYAYLDPKLDSVEALAGTTFDPAVNPASPYVVGQNIKEVFELPYASKHSVTLNADYTFLHFDGGNLSANLNYRWKSSYFNTAPAGTAVPGRDNYLVPAYGLFDGRITMALDLPKNDKVKISIWGKNLLNKDYPQQVIGLGNSISTQDPNTGVVTQAGYVSQAKIWAEPASYGIDVSYQY